MIQQAKPQFRSAIKSFLKCDENVNLNKPSLFFNPKYPLFADTVFAFGSVDIDYNIFLQDLGYMANKYLYYQQFQLELQDSIYNQVQTKLELNQILIYKILKPQSYHQILQNLVYQKQKLFSQERIINDIQIINQKKLKNNQQIDLNKLDFQQRVQDFLQEFIKNIQKNNDQDEINYFNKTNLFIRQQDNNSLNFQEFDIKKILHELEVEEQKPYKAVFEQMQDEEKKLIEPIIQYLFSFFNDQIKSQILKIILSAYLFPNCHQELYQKLINNNQDYLIFNFLIKLKGQSSFFNFLQKIKNLWQQ
ncbi:hypothetical protein TTHERM_00576940 (macronuclear) [Tetrahymena thermophila SB210]|uniref:Uncharacterized protein n=1 Tax=Tetrahymena thermophila (strain SB210) TaxID=312017 RepID=Q22V09_TETTS|nr:hypothetical protein TTHERM_00576940 [Tetrahymena thermophila SB210]EAR89139.2 hypothetical protein TTHERM_00576940 [Tetrahymena thermophila SB210]|eukprot:XP_001009384.2 hypothetical protein TTHERM_00576940 [Tetrahymena thermophila SB210]